MNRTEGHLCASDREETADCCFLHEVVLTGQDYNTGQRKQAGSLCEEQSRNMCGQGSWG